VRTDRRLGPLSSRDFRLFLVGRLTSFIGTGMLPVALAFAVLGRHGSTSEVGYVLGAETLPLVVFLLVGGAAADRLNRRVVMLSADVLRAVAQGVLAAWILVGRPPLWGFLVTQALVGTGNAFFTPAMTGLIPEVAPAETLQQANVLNSMAEWSGRLFGPAWAGVMGARGGRGGAVGADAGTYLLSALCLAGLRVGWSGTAATESFVAQLRTGWRAFRSRTWLWSIVVQFSSYGFFVFAPFFVLGAVVANQSLGGAAAWGTVLALQGLGSVLGSVVMLRVRPRRPLLVAEVGLFGFALPMVALAARAPLAVVASAALVSGASIGVFGPLWDTTMQSQLPPAVLSRASAYDWFGSMVFLPLGYALAGTLARLLGIDGSLYLGAGWLVLTTAVVVSLPGVTSLVGVGHRSAPGAPPPPTPVEPIRERRG
jgi:MFS family permease